MGWFLSNRRPFSRDFFAKLDQLEGSVRSLEAATSAAQDLTPPPEIIPVEITGQQQNANNETEYSWKEITTDGSNVGGRSSTAPDGATEDDFAFAAMDPTEGESFILRHWVAITDTDDQGNTYPLREERRTLITGASISTFYARIATPEGASPAVLCEGQWTYAIVEVEYDPSQPCPSKWVDVADGITGNAINTLEAANTGTLCYGIATTGAPNLYIHNTSNKYQFLPVPRGAVVQVRTAPTVGGGTTYAFSAPNPIDGQC